MPRLQDLLDGAKCFEEVWRWPGRSSQATTSRCGCGSFAWWGFNLSSRQIAQEPGLNKDDAQRMASQLRGGIGA